jgi:hypothetical protein
MFGQQLASAQTIVKNEVRSPWFILNPNSRLKTVWNILLILALLWTATVMPYEVAFIDKEGLFLKIGGHIIDTFFWCDIFLNFFSAYDRPNG